MAVTAFVVVVEVPKASKGGSRVGVLVGHLAVFSIFEPGAHRQTRETKSCLSRNVADFYNDCKFACRSGCSCSLA